MNIPAVGTSVTVTTRFPQRSVWHNENYADITSIGKIIPSPKWLTADQFAISNTKHPSGFSVINITKVISLKTEDGTAIDVKSTPADYKEWNFVGSKGDNYLVICNNGKYTCTCPGFSFRQQCKHVKEATDDTSN